MGQMVRKEEYTPLGPDTALTLKGYLLNRVIFKLIGQGDYWNPRIAKYLVDDIVELWLERVLDKMP